jgi:hypothetical protein
MRLLSLISLFCLSTEAHALKLTLDPHPCEAPGAEVSFPVDVSLSRRDGEGGDDPRKVGLLRAVTGNPSAIVTHPKKSPDLENYLETWVRCTLSHAQREGLLTDVISAHLDVGRMWVDVYFSGDLRFEATLTLVGPQTVTSRFRTTAVGHATWGIRSLNEPLQAVLRDAEANLFDRLLSAARRPVQTRLTQRTHRP